MILFTYTYQRPVYRSDVTLDCAAETREDAMRSARRFIGRLNRRLARVRPGLKARAPASTWDMKPELPMLPIIAEVR